MAGEMAILAGGGVYSATVSAAEDAVLVRVPREVFERIAMSTPKAVREMAGEYAGGLPATACHRPAEVVWPARRNDAAVR